MSDIRKLTVMERSKVAILLDAHCKRDPITGFAVFEDGWSDRKIATELGDEKLFGSVQYVRNATIGQLPRGGNIKTSNDELLQELIGRIQYLEKRCKLEYAGNGEYKSI